MDKYIVSKVTGTHADVLAAVGAADVLARLEPRLVDCSDHFEVRLQRQPTREDVARAGPGFRYLKKAEKPAKAENVKRRPKKPPPTLPPELVFDLSAQSEKDKRQREAKKEKGAIIAEAMAEDAPDPEYRMYSILSRMDAAAGPNDVIEEFAHLPEQEWTQKVWSGLNGSAEFVFEPSLVQLFNPHAAKGYSLLKPNGTDRNDKSKDKWALPFIEWLRYRGYFHGGAAWIWGSPKPKQIRVLCPIPGDISYRLFSDVAQALRKLSLGGSAPKIDSRATLGLARLLIERADTYGHSTLRRVNRWIGGIWIAHYQDMGQSNTLMAIEQLAVPDWFDLKTKEDATHWLETLGEHDRVLRRLSDKNTDEFALLQQYRRFLQRRGDEALAEFLEFLVGYGLLIIRLRGQNKWLLPQFAVERVERIIMDKPTYRDILQNSGLRAIADALRSATVSAQVQKFKKSPDYREIRYGVLPDLKRKLTLTKDDFVQSVAEFVAEYNAESARRLEQSKNPAMPRPGTGRVSDAEFAAFVELMDSVESPPLAGSILCALATCKKGGSPDALDPSVSVLDPNEEINE